MTVSCIDQTIIRGNSFFSGINNIFAASPSQCLWWIEAFNLSWQIVEVVLIRKVGRMSKTFDYLSLLCSSYAAASLEQVSTTFDPRFRSASNTDLQQIYLSRQWIQSINSKLIHHFATFALTIDHSVLSEWWSVW